MSPTKSRFMGAANWGLIGISSGAGKIIELNGGFPIATFDCRIVMFIHFHSMLFKEA